MELFHNLQKTIADCKDSNVLFINGVFYKYADFARVISNIRKSLQLKTREEEKNIGLVTNNDLETYAAIVALWFEGKAYVPLSPDTPKDRNENIIRQAFIETIIDSSEQALFPGYNLVESKQLPESPVDLLPKETSGDELAYILFTSGTTGQPKGVPITRTNLSTFIDSFFEIGFKLDRNDRCLQMFELTFDFSVMAYLVPLVKGACLYTVPKNKIKYAYIYELMEDQKLTFAGMVPSMLHYLRPYFNEINFPDMRYSIFCGEALHLDITEEWGQCLPNAGIYNFYGPTEHTVFCTYYLYNRHSANKSHNGILSIGKAMEGTETILIDEDNVILKAGESGQLCLAGAQLTLGYWQDEEKNKESFFYRDKNGIKERYYKTGDLCLSDEEGDLLYLGRIDFQTKIQGFRVELSEIEFHVKAFLEKTNAVVVAFKDAGGNMEIGLVIESGEFDIQPLLNYLKTKMPSYMVPKRISFADKFPLNNNGKTDRKKLELLFVK